MKSLKEDFSTMNKCVNEFKKKNKNKLYSLNGELNT